jgi:serine/threonine-protein kinase HipA
VIRAYFAARGEESRALSPAQRLLYVGERALGALTYHPAIEIPARAAELRALEIAELVRNARRIIEGAPDVAVPEIYRIGSSAGGMRPKAVVLFNPDTREIRSAFAEPHTGDVPSILKFDGVSDGATSERLGQPMSFNRVEAAYNRMARDAGIDVSEVDVLHEGEHAHLLVRRFDLAADGSRLHQHSLGGLLHVDYNEPGASSYEEYLRTILRLGMPYASLQEGYRRAVFNVLAVNQDDHVKNLSFNMDATGAWRLAPAYDLTFAKGSGWTARHQMQVRDLTADIRQSHLLALAEELGVTRPRRIIDRVASAVASWGTHAAGQGVPARDVARIERELSARRRELSA